MSVTTILDTLNRRGKALAVRACGGIHPKHLVPNPTYAWLLEHVKPGHKVLDLGCGLGLYAAALRVHGANVLAVDKVPPRSDERLDWRGWDLELPLPLCGGLVDRVIALDIIEHLNHRDQFLAECHRVLRPDGALLITFPNRDTRWRRRLRAAGLDARQDPDHKREYTQEEVQRALFGRFRIVSMEPMTYDTPWAGLLDLSAALSLRLYARASAWRVHRAQQEPTETMGWRIVARPES